jgi:hypothetical protein
VRYVRLDALAADPYLSADQKISALALAISELGVAMGLAMIHGERAPRVYVDMGGSIRFDKQWNVLVPVDGPAPVPDRAATGIRCAYCGAPAGEWCTAWRTGQPHRAKELHMVRQRAWRLANPSVPAGTHAKPPGVHCNYCHVQACQWCDGLPAGRLHTIRQRDWQEMSVPTVGTAQEGDPDGR